MYAPSMKPKETTTRAGDTWRLATGGVPVTAYTMTGLAIAAIWVSVALASIFSPDMITGTQHEHVPLAAYADWLWGVIATASVLQATLQGIRARVSHPAPWAMLGIGVTAIWLAVLLVSIFAPVSVTGTDPTYLPFGAMISPFVGMILTGTLCTFAKTTYDLQERAS